MAAMEIVEFEDFEPLPKRPHLRLVSTPEVFRTGPSLAIRRAARARMLRRRRRTLLAAALVMGLVILAWPGHAFGGETGSGLPSDLANSSVLASGLNYTVQAGDSVSSIARMMNPVDPKVAREDLVRELDSSVVVPGERILIP
jgi:hypothetical protein